MNTKPIRIGMIGYGGYGRFLIESWRPLPEVKVVAIASRHRDKLEQASRELGVPRYHVGHDALVADPEVDVVVVASPPALHAEHSLAAIRAGKHLFCEKPLATRVPDGEAVVAAAAAAGVRGVMGYVMRYTPVAQRLKKIADEKLLGDLHRVDLENFAADEHLPPLHWFWNPDLSGGILIEHGVHFFDLYSWIAGSRPQRVSGHRTVRPGTTQEDRVVATVEMENGVLATFYHAFDKPARLERTWASLGFDRGYVLVKGWIPLELELDAALDDAQYARLLQICPETAVKLLEDYSGAAQQMEGAGHQYHASRRVVLRCAPSLDKQAVYAEAVRALLLDLVEAIRRPEHQVLAPLEAGLESLRIAAAAGGEGQ